MSSSPWLSAGRLATADPSEAARLLDNLERELGVQAQPDHTTAARRIFRLDAHDALVGGDVIDATLAKMHPRFVFERQLPGRASREATRCD